MAGDRHHLGAQNRVIDGHRQQGRIVGRRDGRPIRIEGDDAVVDLRFDLARREPILVDGPQDHHQGAVRRLTAVTHRTDGHLDPVAIMLHPSDARITAIANDGRLGQAAKSLDELGRQSHQPRRAFESRLFQCRIAETLGGEPSHHPLPPRGEHQHAIGVGVVEEPHIERFASERRIAGLDERRHGVPVNVVVDEGAQQFRLGALDAGDAIPGALRLLRFDSFDHATDQAEGDARHDQYQRRPDRQEGADDAQLQADNLQ